MSTENVDKELARFCDRNDLSFDEYNTLKEMVIPLVTKTTIANSISDDIREKLWCDVAASVASASNSTNEMTMIRWADTALKAFDERFRK